MWGAGGDPGHPQLPALGPWPWWGASSTRRSCAGLGRDRCLKQPLRSPHGPDSRGGSGCVGAFPTRPGQWGCQGQRGTHSPGLCLPVLGLPVPPVTGCPMPARCRGAGRSRDQGKGIPLLAPPGALAAPQGGSERGTGLAPLPQMPVAPAQPWGQAPRRRERCVPGPLAGMLGVPQPRRGWPRGPLEAPP